MEQQQQQDVSNQVYGGLATVMRVLVLVSIVIGVTLLIRIVYVFFGTLKTAPGYDAIISLTDPLVAPLSMLERIDTPYEGFFDVAGTGVLLTVMVVEFILSSVRSSLDKKSDRALIQSIATRARSTEAELAREDEPVLKD